MAKADRKAERTKRHLRVRKQVHGTSARPRLAVFRSLHHIYAQVIDDSQGRTLVAAATVEPELKAALESTDNTAAAQKVGALVAARALEKGITSVVFDRGGYLYHGRVAALADAARAAGLIF
ncbi:MAG: 50S ribosomal protein L18 [Kiritimatiellia bacterium]